MYCCLDMKPLLHLEIRVCATCYWLQVTHNSHPFLEKWTV